MKGEGTGARWAILAIGAGLIAYGLTRAPVGLYADWSPDQVMAPAGVDPSPRLWLCLGGTPNQLRDRLDVPGDRLYTCRDGRVEEIQDELAVVRWIAPAAPGAGVGPAACPDAPCPPAPPRAPAAPRASRAP